MNADSVKARLKNFAIEKALVQIAFEDAVTGVKTFAEPLLDTENDSMRRWKPENESWE